MQKLKGHFIIGNYVVEVLKPNLRITYKELFKFEDILAAKLEPADYYTSLTMEQIKEFEDINENILKPNGEGFILNFDESKIDYIKQDLERRYRIGLPVFIVNQMEDSVKEMKDMACETGR